MEQHGISKLDLKRQNRMQVLKILKQRGPTSRIDIAGTLELTRAAVTIITNEMISQGVIAEIGEYKHLTEKAPRGRKKILIDINHNFKFVVGIILEEDIISVGLSTLSGAVLDKRNLPIDSSIKYEEIINYLETSIREILTYNCLKTDSILGIGIGILPTMFPLMKIPCVNKVADYSALSKLCKKFTNLPLVFDNSVKGTAMANIDFQKTKDPNRHNIAFLQYGENMNFVVTNLNDPIVSYDNRTDFVDKIIVNPCQTDTCNICGRNGCVKSELTPSAIIKKIKTIYSKENTPGLYELTNGNSDNITYKLIKESIYKGDEAVKEIGLNALHFMAVLINNLIFSTNPQKLVLHDFELTESENVLFMDILRKVGGEEIACLIDSSIIESKHRFLSGCALAIRELFFTRGGFALLD